jgi:hypothetical protein
MSLPWERPKPIKDMSIKELYDEIEYLIDRHMEGVDFINATNMLEELQARAIRARTKKRKQRKD